MHARDIMTRPVVTTTPETSLRDATASIVESGFAALPVVDENGRVVGILSESDALTAGPGEQATTVAAAMTTPVETVTPRSDISTIAVRMLNGRLRSIPVVEAGLLVGIVARRDVLRALIDDDATIASNIRALLDDFAGSRRAWAIDVAEGRVTIRGGFADDAEQRVVATLARSVNGVRHVDLQPITVASLGQRA
ncbi:CBS domain-containing protein [Antrihabitans stalactiti]|uniref:CBS domain-containing protein n=1 Tax=Antrihabitans stalactiti TaxID=2584121 RepID=A0A848K5W9_9NOCA|nr:CBS domain-containing protein [Antrihabitans stalactiti]NMN93961.1 CBS domain-containing protein [Antrihabitans stalactiti]